MTPYRSDDAITLYHGKAVDVLPTLEAGSVACCVTSPPYYGLRDYGVDGQLGAEPSPAEYVAALVATMREVRRVLADDGTLWLNLGDSYTGGGGFSPGSPSATTSKSGKYGTVGALVKGSIKGDAAGGLPAKNLLGIPWRVAFALQDDGWILRNAVVWNKPNAMPESMTDRLSSRYEHVFMFSKSARYWFDLDPIREPYAESTLNHAQRRQFNRKDAAAAYFGNPQRGLDTQPHADQERAGGNPGDVWTIPTSPFPGAHFATFPVALPGRCILAGCKPGGTVLDPFSGSGTTGLAAANHGHPYIGIDLNADYLELSLSTRLRQTALVDGRAS
jgi:DNA modification methylase